MLVIGGYNSSNTGHLLEIAAGKVPAWHIEGAECLVSRGRSCGTSRSTRRPRSRPASPAGGFPAAAPITVGLTAGASTPDVVIGEVVDRVLALRRG